MSNIIVMAFSPRNIVGCLLKKGLQRGEVTGTPGPPSLRLCIISQSTYRYVVTVGPVAVTSIRKLSTVCDFGPGFDIFIGSVTHGPSSIV